MPVSEQAAADYRVPLSLLLAETGSVFEDRGGAAAVEGGYGLMSADYPPAIWDPAASCNYQAFDTVKDTIVILMAEGTGPQVRARYRDCATAASVHYVVSESGTVWQMVPESQVAWHAGCYNQRAIGIMHEGFSTSPDHPQALYTSSARLARHLCETWHIPMLRRTDGGPGILGHEQVAGLCGGSAADPGAGWDWQYYLERIWGSDAGPAIVAAVSSKEHGSAGRFDLSVIDQAVESRRGGPTRLIVTFDSPVSCIGSPATTSVSTSSGRVTAVGADGCRLIVNLTNVQDGCRLAVSFPGVVGSSGLPVTDSLSFGVLRGDVNGDGLVDTLDLTDARTVMESGPVENRLRYDVDVSGVLNCLDLVAIRGRFGRALAAGCP